MTKIEFLSLLQDYDKHRRRFMPWREHELDGRFDAYKILVSEIMLQQTQVNRVIPKFESFISVFPDIASLAHGSLADVLQCWLGLGYNRRAKYLWQAALYLSEMPEPWTEEVLKSCPGIGCNTARAVLAYAYNQPVIFIETNIRTVLLHHFYENKHAVSDKELLETLESLVPWKLGDTMAPRSFYWSMMDYGSYLKTTIGNANKRSKHYTVQSRFEGSQRQLRGKIIRILASGPQEIEEIKKHVNDPRFEGVINQLMQEKLLSFQGNSLMLYNGNQE